MSGARRKRATAAGSRSDDLYRELQDAAEEIGDFVGEHLEQRPYVSLATAAAIGYALGLPRGGLAFLARLGTALIMSRFEGLLGETAPARSASPRRRARSART